MKITGKNLELLAYALSLADDEISNLIGSCPNVLEHADYIANLKVDREAIGLLARRVERAYEREGSKS